MAPPETSAPDLRLAVPTLEPDPEFLARLSELAAGSGAAGTPARALGPGRRTALVVTTAVTVMASGAWVAAAVMGERDSSLEQPTAPVTQPVEPRDAPHHGPWTDDDAEDGAEHDRPDATKSGDDANGVGQVSTPHSVADADPEGQAVGGAGEGDQASPGGQEPLGDGDQVDDHPDGDSNGGAGEHEGPADGQDGTDSLGDGDQEGDGSSNDERSDAPGDGTGSTPDELDDSDA